MKYVWQHISQGDISTAGSSCSKSYLEVMWRKRLLRWEWHQLGHYSLCKNIGDTFPYESLSRPVRLQVPPCQHFSKPWNPNCGGRLSSGFTACLLNVQPTRVPSPSGGHGHLLAKCALEKLDGVMRFQIYNVLIHKASRHSGVPMRAVRLIPLSNLIIHPRKITLLSDN